MAKKLIIFFLFLTGIAFAQKWDTTKYARYNNRLTVGFFSSYRQCDLTLDETFIKDTANKSQINYFAQSKSVIGIDLSYDKFSVSFGIKAIDKENASKLGQTKTFNLGFSVGGTRWILDTYGRTFTGFYVANTGNYDTTFKKTGVYTQFPNLFSGLFRAKFLYFTHNKRFAYRAPYGCSYRQLKTGGTFIVGGSYSLNGTTSDSTIIPYQIKNLYDTTGNRAFRGLIVSGITAYVGGSVTFVIKKALFFNATFIVGPEAQSRTYYFVDKKHDYQKGFINYAGSFNTAIGFNFKKGYIAFTNMNDFNAYNKTLINLDSKNISICFMAGYRIPVKTPKLYQKFQETKIYKIF